MKMLTPPWKTAWYDDKISDRFFREMSRIENNSARQIETSAQWLNLLVVEMGQLAQNLNHLEHEAPHPSQVRLAMEKALKISALAAHLAAALDRADPAKTHAPPVLPGPRPGEGGPGEAPPAGLGNAPHRLGEDVQHPQMPLRQTVAGLSRRGLSVAEIEVITGQPRSQIESVLNER